MTNPKMDFRYRHGDIELEGYQITPATRHSDQEWPPWLKRQRLPEDINSVFSMVENPNRLWLNLPTGEVELPELAWIVQYPDGHLGIIDALDFEDYEKVVPIPPKVHTPPADGMEDESHMAEQFPQHIKEGNTIDDYRRSEKPAEAPATVVPIKVEDFGAVGDKEAALQDEMMKAIRLLQDEQTEEALDHLIHSMAKRTTWCTCAPGMCSGKDQAGCRMNSPLVKA